MAESESKGGGGGEGRRKKRAWRKPREPATPTSDEGGGGMAAAKPIKLVRGVSSSSSTTPFTTPGSATFPPPHANGTGACVGSEKEGAKGGGTASEVVGERLDLTSLVSIDGSIMEGVCMAFTWIRFSVKLDNISFFLSPIRTSQPLKY